MWGTTDTRFTAVEEITMDHRSENPQFFDPETGLLLNPSTKVRNDIEAAMALAPPQFPKCCPV